MRKGQTGASTPSLSVSAEDGTIELVISTTKEAVYTIMSESAIQTGRWSHVAVSISLSAIALYINGFQDTLRTFDQKVVVIAL